MRDPIKKPLKWRPTMVADPPRVLGSRIRELRRKLNLKQEKLATELGVGSAQIISQIETGKREVKAWELAKLSRLLHVSLTDLLATEDPKPQPSVLWRVLPSPTQRSAKEARFLNRCKEYALLEELSGTTRPRQFPQKRVDATTIRFREAGDLADEIRREFALGEQPATSLEKTLQNQYGVKIWYEDLEEGSAAATLGDFGPAILMNRNEAPWRRNYNFAHELFHLITWESIPATPLQQNEDLWEKIEKVANSFASCLLLPADPVTAEIEKRAVDNRIEYSDLVEIARNFDVSTQALIYRLQNLRLVTKDTAESILNDEDFSRLDRSTMSGRWWEPSELPERFVRLAFVAYQKGRLSRARLAQLLETTLPDVTKTLWKYGLDDREIQKKIAVCPT
jgi:Zn-dependent peptidase ImmA (M78 family)/DNA-binding XRE family transcriptional regulator